jgi:hypothetical protein
MDSITRLQDLKEVDIDFASQKGANQLLRVRHTERGG